LDLGGDKPAGLTSTESFVYAVIGNQWSYTRHSARNVFMSSLCVVTLDGHGVRRTRRARAIFFSGAISKAERSDIVPGTSETPKEVIARRVAAFPSGTARRAVDEYRANGVLKNSSDLVFNKQVINETYFLTFDLVRCL